MIIELKNLKPIEYYENEIIVATKKINATNEFLSQATNETEMNFGNKMNKLLLKQVYHNREIIKYLRSINKLMQPFLN